jgi:hypothetical protein
LIITQLCTLELKVCHRGKSGELSFSYDPKNHTTSVTPPGGQALNMTYSGSTQT